MSCVLLIDDDPGTLLTLSAILRLVGHRVLTASSGSEALQLLAREPVQLVIADLVLPDRSGLELLHTFRRLHSKKTPFLMISGYATAKDAIEAFHLGASDFLEKPIFDDELCRNVERFLSVDQENNHDITDSHTDTEAHAAARWARAVVAIIDSPEDIRTVPAWARWIAASPGALRNWCRSAELPPRRSLVFGRMLRAVLLNKHGRRSPTNLLNVVDRRTLAGLLVLAGFDCEEEIPNDLRTFLDRQKLIRDRDALHQLARLLQRRE